MLIQGPSELADEHSCLHFDILQCYGWRLDEFG